MMKKDPETHDQRCARLDKQERLDQTARLYFALKCALPLTSGPDPKKVAEEGYRIADVLESARAKNLVTS